MIVYWDGFIMADTTVDFNRPDIVLIDRQNKGEIVINAAVLLTLNLPKTEAQEIMKYQKYPEA